MRSARVLPSTSNPWASSPPRAPHPISPPTPLCGALTLLVEVDRGGRERGLDAVGEGVTLHQ